jgi:hypothetical protein
LTPLPLGAGVDELNEGARGRLAWDAVFSSSELADPDVA